MVKSIIKKNPIMIRRIGLMIYDVIAVYLAAFLALFIRFDFILEEMFTTYFDTFLKHSVFAVIITLICFNMFKLYSSLWSYASVREAKNILKGCAMSSLVLISSATLVGQIPMPRSFYLMDLIILFVLVFVCRFLYREIRELKNVWDTSGKKTRVMIVGAGAAGAALIREIVNSGKVDKKVVCLIDDHSTKLGNHIAGIKIVGSTDDIADAAERYSIEEILIAIPSATPNEMKRILETCKETGIRTMKLPGIYQMVNGEVSISQLKEIEINDLLARDPVETNLDSVMGYVSGKVILVTGGGGSIGSELCRQLADCKPKQLIIFDNYENTTYEIQTEIKKEHPELNLVVLIGSVRNQKRINRIFEKYRPEIIYHAAARKHVPLMEESPNEAIQNNVLGTWKIAEAAVRWKAEKFVMISTDKAVNPTNVMGATKRICEMIVQTFNEESDTEFVTVRFGNVLGSNGSVIPLFKRQIAEGGPVTVTHPEIIRYFMTIPEAVDLVLQAGGLANGGEIFVLDMGEPVKIADLARNLILLSGLKPEEDIKIEYTGLRPGEKLYEEILMSEEGLKQTENKLIFIGKQIPINKETLIENLKNLEARAENEPEDIIKNIKSMVPTYNAMQNF